MLYKRGRPKNSLFRSGDAAGASGYLHSVEGFLTQYHERAAARFKQRMQQFLLHDSVNPLEMYRAG